MLNNCQFKPWCKGDKSNIENSTDHFFEDTRQNALAALANLGHVTESVLSFIHQYQHQGDHCCHKVDFSKSK